MPSCWEQRGFGSYNHGRDYKTYGKNFRFADEQGKYKRTFTRPADWQQQAVFLAFEGTMTDAEVRVLPLQVRHQPAAESQPAQFTGGGWWPETGRTLNDSIHLLDANLIN